MLGQSEARSSSRLRPLLERPSAIVQGWGTALPAHRYEQVVLSRHLGRSLDARSARRLRAAFRGSGVRTRSSVLPDFADNGAEPLLFDGGSKSTAERLRVFRRLAPSLAATAARRALDDARVPAARATHFLFVTCTGFAAPGPDLDLVETLGLSRGVRRVQIGFQGCSAGIVALRTAAEIVRGDPAAVVLIVSVELCSLHFQTDLAGADVRGHALFADGAAAAVVAARPAGGGASPAPRTILGEGRSLVVPEHREDMTWEVEDEGFRMGLSARVPDALAAGLPRFVAQFGLPSERVLHWAVHPGGPSILDRVGEALAVPPGALECSREVLRRCGNMSSATIFFVLRAMAGTGGAGDGVALAFGPGLTVDGLRFRIESG